MSNGSMERRVLPNDEAELRLHEGDDGPRLEGYAAVFNSKSRDLGGFREVFMEGAFESALDGSDIRSLFNHDPSAVLGRESNGTLDLSVDKRGLRYRVDLPKTPTAQEVRELVGRRDVTGSSLTFNVSEDGDTFESRGDGMVRFVESVERVGDVGPVTYPAYQATEVSARALDAIGAERQTDQDMKQRIRSRLQEQFGGEDVFIWVEATFMEEGEVVYRREEDGGGVDYFRIGFEVDGEGGVSLGSPTPVKRVTEFEEIEDGAGEEDSDRDLYLYDVARETELVGP